MNSFPIKKILLLKYSNKQKGFTLIELLVVTIIVGILSAIALPNLLAQVGKARESEGKVNLGILSRSQEAYHFENQIFADTIAKLTSNVTLNTNYYSFPDPATATNLLVLHQAIPANPANPDAIRNYASGVYFDASSSDFDIILCQSNGVNQTVDAPNTSSGDCTNNGIQIK